MLRVPPLSFTAMLLVSLVLGSGNGLTAGSGCNPAGIGLRIGLVSTRGRSDEPSNSEFSPRRKELTWRRRSRAITMGRPGHPPSRCTARLHLPRPIGKGRALHHQLGDT